MLNTNKLCDISFIYHPADLRFVRRIDARMTAKDVDCQVSEAELGKTDEGKNKLKADILRSHLVAIVLSPQSAASQTCGELIQYAVSSGKRLVTLIVDEDIKVDVHPAIAENPYIFFRQQDALEDGIQKLLELAVANQHIRLHTELLVYASRWHQNKRADNLLLPPTRVHQARQWLADGANRLPKPSPLQVEYIHASRRQKPAAKRSLSVYQMLALAVLIGIAVVIGSLQNAVANRPTATAATVAAAAESVQTQAPALGLTTAVTASSAVALADIAASVADAITQMAQTDTPSTAAPPLAAPAEAESPDATQVFASAVQTGDPPLLLAAEQALEAGDVDLALVLALALDDLDQAYRILSRAAALNPPVLPGAIAGTALNASGEGLLIASRGGAVLQNSDTQETIAAFEDSRIARMNSSGSHFAVHSENSIAVYDAVTGSEQAAWTVDMNDIQDLALAPTGDHVLISVRSGELWHLRPDSGAAQPLPASGLGPAWMTRFAADGSLFMTLHAESAALWETATASPRQSYALGLAPDFPFSERFRMAFSPAGDKLYFLAQLDNDLASLTVLSLNDSSVKRQAFVDVQHGELTANGEHLLLALSDHSIQIIDTASGEVSPRLIGHQAAIRKLHYQEQHSRLLSASDDNRLILWDVAAAAIDRQYVHPNGVLDFSPSQDGRRILSRDRAGAYRLWQVESRPELLERIQSTFSPRGLTCAERRQYNVPPLCEQPRWLER